MSSEPPDTVLLVNMTEALALLALLQQAHGRQQEHDVDAHHTKHRGENVIQKHVDKTGDRGHTATHECSSGRARACSVGDENGGRRGVKVTTAGECSLHQALDVVRLRGENLGEAGARLEGHDPEVQAKNHGENGADNCQITADLDPGTRSESETGKRGDESNENEYRVDNTRCYQRQLGVGIKHWLARDRD